MMYWLMVISVADGIKTHPEISVAEGAMLAFYAFNVGVFAGLLFASAL